MRWTHTHTHIHTHIHTNTQTHTQPPDFSGGKTNGRRLFTQVHGESGLGMGGALPLLSRMSLWIVQEQLYLPFIHSLQF
jgi:hypothetical protein